MRLYRVKAKALELLGIEHKSLYAKVNRYMVVINKTYMGSMVDI